MSVKKLLAIAAVAGLFTTSAFVSESDAAGYGRRVARARGYYGGYNSYYRPSYGYNYAYRPYGNTYYGNSYYRPYYGYGYGRPYYSRPGISIGIGTGGYGYGGYRGGYYGSGIGIGLGGIRF